MKIGIMLVDFNPGRMGGVETYLRNLVRWLALNDHDNRYTLICTDQNVGYFEELFGHVDTMVFNNRKNSPQRLGRSLVRKLTGIDPIRVACDRAGFDLLHNPFTSVRCLGAKTPLIVTFHDIQHRFFPQFFREKDVALRDRNSRKAALGASFLIADSEYTKVSLAEAYGVPESRMQVVLLGVGEEYRPLPAELLAEERRALGLERPFLYYPAATWLHKNHANLLAALKIMEKTGFDGELVLTGVATKARDGLLAQIAELGLSERVRVLGYLPYEKLPVIYNLARLTVFPSLFEGFGMPVLEAMGCGCPVACSNVTSIPEVGGDAVRYFDPTSPEQIAQTVLNLWGDDSALAELRRMGLERVAEFTWENTSRRTLEVYRDVLKRCGRKA
ncbi:glycosyltransferase family 1 protein [Geomonas sp.]|uniref:glycosyltransferase family 4 protein n=1 Tax=Geomonas sp. TaxID=2651584 RepID=UPI002B48054F|nr:glycosyltransferase family 1 protein [Geomonas sp.]HJV34645.1 glycosyltransferase family 1 protein [Geomonas sp.]